LTGEGPSRKGLVVALFFVGLLAAAAFWGPRWWDRRLYRQEEALVGVGAPVLKGRLTEARAKVDPGRSAKQVEDAIGRPSLAVGTQGSSSHDIWTYYYADGTMRINLTDGIVQRIAVEYGPPRIPASRRR
jgi:hypothetical protein